MDASLVKNVEVVRHRGAQVLIRHSDLDESNRGKVDLLSQKFRLDDFTASRQLLAEAFHFRYELFGLSWTEAADELEHGVHMLVLTSKIDVDANLIDDLNVDFF